MVTQNVTIAVSSTGVRQVNRDLSSIGRQASATRRLLSFLRAALVAVAAVGVLRGFVEMADTFVLMSNRIKLLTSSTQQLAAVQRELFRISQDTRTSLESNATVFTRLTRATLRQKLSFRELLDITRGIGQAVALSGAQSQEARNALIQFSQGLASGALRGDELRSVSEQLPFLAEIIGKEFNVAGGELIAFAKANDGALTTVRILKAIQGALPELNRQFGLTASTIGQALERVSNALSFFIGGVGDSIGLTRGLASAINVLADNIDKAVLAFLALTGVFVFNFLFSQIALLNTNILLLGSGGVSAIRGLLRVLSVLLVPFSLIHTALQGIGSLAAVPFVIMAGAGRALITVLRAVVFPLEAIRALLVAIRVAVLANPLFFLGAALVAAATAAFIKFKDEILATVDALGGLRGILNIVLASGIAVGRVLAGEWRIALGAIIEQAIDMSNAVIGAFEVVGNGALIIVRRLSENTIALLARMRESLILITAFVRSVFILAFEDLRVVVAASFEKIIDSVNAGIGATEALINALISGTATALIGFGRNLGKIRTAVLVLGEAIVRDFGSIVQSIGLVVTRLVLEFIRRFKRIEDAVLGALNALIDRINAKLPAALAITKFDRNTVRKGLARGAQQLADALADEVRNRAVKPLEDAFVNVLSTRVDLSRFKRDNPFRGAGDIAAQRFAKSFNERFGPVMARELQRSRSSLGAEAFTFVIDEFQGFVDTLPDRISLDRLDNRFRGFTEALRDKFLERFREALADDPTGQIADALEAMFEFLRKFTAAGLGPELESLLAGTPLGAGGGKGFSPIAKQLKSDLESLTDELFPLSTAIREAAEAEETLNKAIEAGLFPPKLKELALKRLRREQSGVGNEALALSAQEQFLNKQFKDGEVTASEFTRTMFELKESLRELDASASDVINRDIFGGLSRVLDFEGQVAELTGKIQSLRAANARPALAEAEALNRLTREFVGVGNAATDYLETQELLNRAMKTGAISANEFKRALRDARIAFLDTQFDFASGVERALLKMQRDFDDAASTIERTITGAFERMEDSIVSFVTTGKIEIGDLADFIIEEITRATVRQFITQPLNNLLSGGANSLFGLLGGGGGGGGGGFNAGAFDVASQVDSFSEFGGGGGGFFDSLANFPGVLFGGDLGSLFGFQHGFDGVVGGRGGVDNNLIAFKASRGERVTVDPAGGGGGGRGGITFNVVANDVNSFLDPEAQMQIAARLVTLTDVARERGNV